MNAPRSTGRRLWATAAAIAALGCAARPTAGPEPKGRVAENVFVIDDPALVVAPGQLRLPREGNEPLLARTPGDVLVSSQRGGLLRRIGSIDATAEAIRIETEPASLSDAFVDARLRKRLSLGSRADAAAAGDDGPVGARSAALLTDGFDLTLGPRRITARPDVDAELLEGNVDFDPDVDVELTIDDRELKRLAMRVAGQLQAKLKVRIQARGERALLDVDQKLWSRERLFVQFIGGVPVVETVKLDFGVGVEGTVTGEIEAVFGGSVDAELAAGSEWKDDRWHDLGTRRVHVFGDAPEVEGEGELEAARAYLYARVSIKLYDIAGPFVDVRPNVYLERHDDTFIGTSAGLRSEFGVLAGLPIIDLTTGIYRSLLFDVSYPLDRSSADAPAEEPDDEKTPPGGEPADEAGDDSDGCPSLPEAGSCREGVLQFCDGGIARRRDCTEDKLGCGWHAEKRRYGCVNGCGDLDFEGTCRGGTLRYCAYGTVRLRECEDECGRPEGASASFCL